MVRCENCGKENDKDATFCEKCGSDLKTTFSRGFSRGNVRKTEGMGRSTKILILVCIILVAGLSIVAGVMVPSLFHPIQNNSFSDSGISFQYPGNWSDNATVTWTDSNSLENETIGKLGNGNVTLGVLYEPVSSYDLQALGKITVDSWSKNGVKGSVISNTVGQVGANPVDIIIYNNTDPVTNVLYENYYVLLGGSGNHVYAMRFRAPQTDFAKYYPQFQSIVGSIKIVNQEPVTTPTVTNPTEPVVNNNVQITSKEANQIIINSGVPPNLTLNAQLVGNSYQITAYDVNDNVVGSAVVDAQTGTIESNDI
jgi:hypothetical protein